MAKAPKKKTFLIDMDGVLVQGQRAIPGAREFIEKLKAGGHKFLILTNNSRYSPTDLQHRLQKVGIPVGAENFYSSAMATAQFVSTQKPGGSAFVIGATGLYQALNEANYKLTDYSPDFVILGEMENYPGDTILGAIRHILAGVPFIATNPDAAGPTEHGVVPACGAVAALLEKATGYKPYFIGKPNPLIMRLALRSLDEHSENAVMVGDNMDTDIIVGLESGLQTCLMLTGVTDRARMERYPYRPDHVLDSVADLDPDSF